MTKRTLVWCFVVFSVTAGAIAVQPVLRALAEDLPLELKKLPPEDEKGGEVSGIGGSGTANYLAKWADATNLSNAVLYETGGRIGMGTTNPFSDLEVKDTSDLGSDAILTLNTSSMSGLAGLYFRHNDAAAATWTLQAITPTLSDGKLTILSAQPYPFSISTGGVERIYLDGTGNVGIGTTNPNMKFDIDGTGLDNNGEIAVMRITSGNGAQHLLLDGNEIDAVADGLFLNNNTTQNVVLANGGGNVGIGVANPTKKLEVAGTTKTQVVEITGGSDLAEPFRVHGIVEPGMAVVADVQHPGDVQPASKPYDPAVIGIVSGANGVKPGIVMKQEGSSADGTTPIAIAGRVYALVDASFGAVNVGDLLTTSATSGYLMKATHRDRAHGAVVGKALTSLTGGRGFVLLVVSLQ